MDVLAGGYYQINDLVTSGLSKFPNSFPTLNYFNNQCFIPAASSMAINNVNIDWGSNLSTIDVQTGTPFKSILPAQGLNEDHVLITPAAVNFIKSKLSATTCN